MKSVEFCYWLQGYFELKQYDTESDHIVLTQKQLDCVKKHLHLVFTVEKNGTSKSFYFCVFLLNYLSVMEISNNYTNRIMVVLNSVFKHEIDNLYQEKEKLNMIHNEKPNFSPNSLFDEPKIRC